MSENAVIEAQQDMWAVVELMGHGQTAGRIEKPTEWGGLMRVDVPDDDGDGYRTEFYSMSAIYSIKFVSEEVARAFAPKKREVAAYNTPIVTREQHDSAMSALRSEKWSLERKIDELQRRLVAIQGLPSGDSDGSFFDEEEIPL